MKTTHGEIERRLDGLLRGLAARKNVKHALLAVEAGDGGFRWTGTAGPASPGGPPMRADTPYFLASVTKLHIAAVVLRLHEAGRLSIDAPMAGYLPGPLVAGLHRSGGVDRTGEITIRHLLGHTSGLADCLEDRPKGGTSFLDRILSEGDRAFTREELFRVVREELAPHFPPQPADARRPRIRYSDTNFQLLLEIIEAVTGAPLHVAFEDHLLRPLDLRDTWLPGHPRGPGPEPEPATLWIGDEPATIPLALRSVGDLAGTAADAIRFLRALVRGEVFREPATAGLLQARWNRFGLPLDPAALRLASWPIEYGLGMMRFRLPRLLTPFAPIPAVVGHSGSTGTWLFHCPERDLFLAGTVDQAMEPALPFRFMPRLLRALSA